MSLALLWGIHFSGDKSLQDRKQDLLQCTLNSLSDLLRDPLSQSRGVKHPRNKPIYNLMLAIALNTSLATYFFTHGRVVEGNYHSNNASQLAICAGLHRAQDPRNFQTLNIPANHDTETRPGSPGAGLLPIADSQDEALFRHHLFWNTFVLDRSWSAVGGAPSPSWRWGSPGLGSLGSEGLLNERSARTTIQTPWPEDWGLLFVSPTWTRFR
jgi:hypothetical protein